MFSLGFAGQVAAAQGAQDAPLSVIDWLSDSATQAAQKLQTVEPPVAGSGAVPDVAVAPLGADAPRQVGLAPADVTGLPADVWAASAGAALTDRIETMPALTLPAAQTLFYTLLLAEAEPPRSGAAAFNLARVDALTELGALDPARALIEQAGVDRSAAHFARYMDLSLLSGTEDFACATLRADPKLSNDPGHDVFCTARAGDWDTAALLLGTTRVLGLIDEPMTEALERFLDPDLYEGEPNLPLPRAPDALAFRVYAAIGTPIPSRAWPRVYANADLADTAGWKAQLEAAERLAQTGALPANKLLGVYTARAPAASGGIWDRVAAVQRLETALGTGSAAAVSKTLPAAWRAMKAARLATVFAELFADRLPQMDLSGAAADAAFEVVLLSPNYETAADAFPSRAHQRPALAGIARGEGIAAPDDATPRTRAAVQGFVPATAPDSAVVARARTGALGAALLDTLAQLQAGADGDLARLPQALSTLRALGLEDTARRAALQFLLLEEGA